MPKYMPKHRFWYCFHQATRSEELVAMFHAANDTIGIDKVRRNETTIAQYILVSLQGMSRGRRVSWRTGQDDESALV